MNQDQTIIPPRRFLIKDKEGLRILAEGIQWMDGKCLLRFRPDVDHTPLDAEQSDCTMQGIQRLAGLHDGMLCWLDRSNKPHNSLCARCGADHGHDIHHCIDCGASPNILVPKWFSEGTMSRDEHRLESLKKRSAELKWLRSQLPVPQEVVATHSKTFHADLYEKAGEPNPWAEDDWSVSLFNTSVGVKADSKEEARRKGADLLSWHRLINGS